MKNMNLSKIITVGIVFTFSICPQAFGEIITLPNVLIEHAPQWQQTPTVTQEENSVSVSLTNPLLAGVSTNGMGLLQVARTEYNTEKNQLTLHATKMEGPNGSIIDFSTISPLLTAPVTITLPEGMSATEARDSLSIYTQGNNSAIALAPPLNLTYTVSGEDENNKTLTYTPTGAIADFYNQQQSQDFLRKIELRSLNAAGVDYDDIKNYVIDEGTTNVGAWFFPLCNECESLTLPDSITSMSTSRLKDFNKIFCGSEQINNGICSGEALEAAGFTGSVFRYEKNGDAYNVYDAHGNLLGTSKSLAALNQYNPLQTQPKRRIYTLEEATKAVSGTDRNTFSIRYR